LITAKRSLLVQLWGRQAGDCAFDGIFGAKRTTAIVPGGPIVTSIGLSTAAEE